MADGYHMETPLNTFSLFFTGMLFFWVVPYLPTVGKRSTALLTDLTIASFFLVLMIYGRTFSHEIFAAALLFCVLYPSGLFRWIFANLFQIFGIRCYSVYLTHLFAIHWGQELTQKLFSSLDQPDLNLILCFAVTTCLVLIFAELFYRFVELPSQRLGRRLSDSL
jgi:peptidoglycan/LPS O-acetylase OafA/YrhL